MSSRTSVITPDWRRSMLRSPTLSSAMGVAIIPAHWWFGPCLVFTHAEQILEHGEPVRHFISERLAVIGVPGDVGPIPSQRSGLVALAHEVLFIHPRRREEVTGLD